MSHQKILVSLVPFFQTKNLGWLWILCTHIIKFVPTNYYQSILQIHSFISVLECTELNIPSLRMKRVHIWIGKHRLFRLSMLLILGDLMLNTSPLSALNCIFSIHMPIFSCQVSSLVCNQGRINQSNFIRLVQIWAGHADFSHKGICISFMRIYV